MPRQPLGDRPMTNAERQARHRAARATAQPVIQYPASGPPPQPRPTLVRRGRRARCFAGRIRRLARCAPETLRDSATGEALQAIVELDLDELTAVPPRGYGRD